VNGQDSLREILPLLRPRSAEPTLFSQIVWYVLWIGLASLPIAYLIRWIRLRRRRLHEFNLAAQTAGLRPKQIDLLLQIARWCRMKSPTRMLHSAQVFDRQVGSYATDLAGADRQHPELVTISKIREILGFDELDLEQPLTSTRQIDRGQTMMVGIGGDDGEEVETFTPWLVLERDEGTLRLSPVLRAGTERVAEPRPGDRLSARFWREGEHRISFRE
jgi:hypothetical protein